MSVNKTEIIAQLRELDRRMIALRDGQANWEYETLEVKYKELLNKLRSKQCQN